jgi:hypothetical protein
MGEETDVVQGPVGQGALSPLTGEPFWQYAFPLATGVAVEMEVLVSVVEVVVEVRVVVEVVVSEVNVN